MEKRLRELLLSFLRFIKDVCDTLSAVSRLRKLEMMRTGKRLLSLNYISSDNRRRTCNNEFLDRWVRSTLFESQKKKQKKNTTQRNETFFANERILLLIKS